MKRHRSQVSLECRTAMAKGPHGSRSADDRHRPRRLAEEHVAHHAKPHVRREAREAD